MGAKELQPVQIMCVLSQSQIEELVAYVSACLPVRTDDLNDIDELKFNGKFRLCVEFDVDTLGNLKVLEAEILDRDWEVLEADSFALSHYLEPIIKYYNNGSKSSQKQEKEIIEDRKAVFV